MATGWEALQELDVAAAKGGLSPEGHQALGELREAAQAGTLSGTPPEGFGARAAPRGTGIEIPTPLRYGAEALAAIPGAVTLDPALAIGGASLAGTAMDVVEGKADPTRLGLQGLATAAFQASPLGRELGMGKRVLGSGLVTAFAGQLYDAAKDWWQGKPSRSVGESLKSEVEDVIGGALGQSVAEGGAARSAARGARRDAAISRVADRRAQFERGGMTPRASELTDSPAIESLEDRPRGSLTGARAVRSFEERRTREATGALESRISDISPSGVTDLEWAGSNMSAAMRDDHAAARERWQAAFSATENVTGNENVVPMGNLRAKARSELRTAEQTPYGAARGTAKLARDRGQTVYEFTGKTERSAGPAPGAEAAPGEGAPAAPTGLYPPGVEAPPEQSGIYPPGIETTALAPTSREVAPYTFQGEYGEPLSGQEDVETLILEATKHDKIPFWLARRIESQLGYMGFHGRPPVGATPQQRSAGLLYEALMRDFDGFYDTEVGQQIRPELQAAKQQFKVGMAIYNHARVRNFIEGKVDPERAVELAFRPGNVTGTRMVQAALPSEVFDEGVQGWLHGLYRKHVRTVGDQEDFDMSGFARDIQQYDKNNHLDVILGEQRANDLRELVATWRLTKRPGSPMQRSSGTAERAERWRGMRVPAVAMGEMLGGILAGHPIAGMAAAAGTAADAYGVPAALGHMTTSPGGINFLTNAAMPRAPLSLPSRTGMGQLSGQGMLDWLRRLQTPAIPQMIP